MRSYAVLIVLELVLEPRKNPISEPQPRTRSRCLALPGRTKYRFDERPFWFGDRIAKTATDIARDEDDDEYQDD
jgi:hypothetical protein